MIAYRGVKNANSRLDPSRGGNLSFIPPTMDRGALRKLEHWWIAGWILRVGRANHWRTGAGCGRAAVRTTKTDTDRNEASNPIDDQTASADYSAIGDGSLCVEGGSHCCQTRTRPSRRLDRTGIIRKQ